jgi:hypothetical protein
MSCILIRCTFGDDPAISSGVTALFVFLVLAPWWPSEESDWTEIWYTGFCPRQAVAPTTYLNDPLMQLIHLKMQ